MNSFANLTLDNFQLLPCEKDRRELIAKGSM